MLPLQWDFSFIRPVGNRLQKAPVSILRGFEPNINIETTNTKNEEILLQNLFILLVLL